MRNRESEVRRFGPGVLPTPLVPWIRADAGASSGFSHLLRWHRWGVRGGVLQHPGLLCDTRHALGCTALRVRLHVFSPDVGEEVSSSSVTAGQSFLQN